MNNYVVMPQDDWANALDSVRTKAQITDAIKSGDLSTIIDSIGVKALNIPHLTAIAGGTFIPTSDTYVKDVTITHNLGVQANFYIVKAKEQPPGNGYGKTALYFVTNFWGLVGERYYDTTGGNTFSFWYGSVGGDTTSIDIDENHSVKVVAGKEYMWICGVIG